ncbi:MAG TPA: sodium:calcium antiporter [Polyangiaceae bacterium]|nr:sodium:calcium antiporter [Polyangiaceae bacterium]
MSILFYVLVTLASTAIVWKGSALLESSAERLAVHYRLPDIVTGAVVVAIGSSFPELSTTVLSTLLHGEFELGVSAIVGSAIFNILVIPGLSRLASDNQLQSNRDLVYKEAQFYMLSVAVLLITFAFAAIYNPVTPAVDDSITGTMTRPLALIPMVMYVLYLFVQWQDTMDYEPEADASTVVAYKEWLRLLLSLVLILVAVEGLVQSALFFGKALGTPAYLWGITVVAAGTSVPDAFVSVQAARKGNAITSLANVLGSNIFDLLICIPVGVMLAGTTTINFSVATPMMAILTVATLALFLTMRTEMKITRWEAWLLVALYAAFVVWIGLESFRVIDTVRSLPPADAP